MQPAPTTDRPRLEGLAVAVVTLLGAGVRLWPPGRFGLTHFDEGIYAMGGAWSLGPSGLAGIEPTLIPYAPPGFAILIGLAYQMFGPSDLAAIGVSQTVGTLTIPVVAWLARRTFGPGAGLAAAAFCAFSGPHIAFSRMALTDVSFLFTWLLAIGASMRFLERPVFARALTMGLAVGLAQQFKYNGWLAGGIVIGCAIPGGFVRRNAPEALSQARVFGWGGAAAAVAGVVVWPWYRFVEAHGGYTALLRHQQSYVGGVSEWWPHLRVQADQAVALSGGRGLIGLSLAMAGLALAISRPSSGSGSITGLGRWRLRSIILGSALLPLLFVDAPYWLGLVLAPWLLTWSSPSGRIVATWWLVLVSISPFYHPYARLWLPLHAANWLLMGWLVTNFSGVLGRLRQSPDLGRSRGRRRVETAYVLAMLALGIGMKLATRETARSQPDLMSPSDSLRRASGQVVANLPKDVVALRLLVRPPVTFYLAGRVSTASMAGPDQLRLPGPPRVWALVDAAILRSEARQDADRDPRSLLSPFASHWELVEEFPTTLALPTILDLDPASACVNSGDRSAPLWLLRPRRTGPPR